MLQKPPAPNPPNPQPRLLPPPIRLKYLPYKKSSINSIESPSKHSHKNKDTIDFRASRDITDNSANQRIQRLVEQLFPLLEDVEKDRVRDRKDGLFRMDGDADGIFDSITTKGKLENKMSMNAAQKELDQRLKNKLVEKSKKSSGEMARSYREEYEDIKKQNLRINTENNQMHYEPPEVSPEGVNFYEHLKFRPALLKYTIQKIKAKQLQRGLDSHNPDIASMPLLSILNHRKRKQVQNPQKITLRESSQKDHYNKQIQNITNISSRLKRIYSKQNQLKINDHQIQEIQNSRIIKHQHFLLEEIDQCGKVCKRNKEKLIFKFNQILSQYGRSSSRRKVIVEKMDARNQADISRLRALKRKQHNSSADPRTKKHETL